MTTATEPTPSPTRRIASVDVFRGLTIFAMIFVNDLAGLRDIPAWMKHMPVDQDGMTFVDVVFPAFLFIVGMAIPLAVGRRIERGQSLAQTILHIVTRTLALLVLGVFMVNVPGLNATATGISKDLWALLLFVAAILVWNAYPASTGPRRMLFLGLRGVGVVVLIALAVIYRGGEGENLTWMGDQLWGFLGLIGWAYLTACIVYMTIGRQLAGFVAALALLIALYIGDSAGALAFLGPVRDYIALGPHIGGHSAIVVAGTITMILVLSAREEKSPVRTILHVLVFAAALAAAGYLLRPQYGISKERATPAWCLYSAAICCTLYVLLYWIVDVRKRTRWSVFLAPAGANPLLAYILPDILFAVLGIAGIRFLSEQFNAGYVGIVRSAVFSLAIVGLTAILSRLHIRLRL